MAMTQIYDSGRFPMWFRIPALTFGMFALWLGVVCGMYFFFGIKLMFELPDSREAYGLGVVICLAIAYVWIFAWFIRMQIFYDSSTQELVIIEPGLSMRPRKVRIALSDIRSFHLHYEPTRGLTPSGGWKLYVTSDAEQNKYLAQLRGVQPESFAKCLQEATNIVVLTTSNS